MGFLKRFTYYFYLLILKIKGKQIVHFFHIRKNAGSMIISSLQKNRSWLFGNIMIFGEYVFLTHKHEFNIRNVKNGEKVFFVVRDPIERFISGFNSRKREGKPKNYNPWNESERIAFGNFPSPSELAEALSSNDERKRDMAIQAMYSIRHVNSFQLDWFINESVLKNNIKLILFVVNQDNLGNKLKSKFKSLGLQVDLISRNSINAHSSNGPIDLYLSDEARKNLIKWYSKDYRFLNLLKEEGVLK